MNTIAQQIIDALPEFSKTAAAEAKVWEKGSKCRVYFGRQFLDVLPDGTVDIGSNPYAISELLDRLGIAYL